MRPGIIIDDFTGASDVANILASSRVRTIMMLSIDAADVDETFDANPRRISAEELEKPALSYGSKAT